MKWTRTPPDRAGWWWCRTVRGAPPLPIRVAADDIRLATLQSPRFEWSDAPIEEPSDSNEGTG